MKQNTFDPTPVKTEESAEAAKLSLLPLVQSWNYCVTRDDVKPLVPIVDDILCPGSKMMIAAGAKVGKTWITIQLAAAIAAGESFLGRKCQKKRVLYVNLEIDDHNFTRRIRVFSEHLGYAPDPEHFYHIPMRGNMRVGVELNMEAVIEVVEAVGIDVVVLDPVYKLNHEGDENSSRDMTRLCNAIDRLTTRTGCAVILNDHTGKGSMADKDPMDCIRGSSAKAGDMDSMLIVRRLAEKNGVRVDFYHRHLPPVEPMAARFEFPFLVPAPGSDVDDLHTPGLVKKKEKAEPRDVVMTILEAMAETTADDPMSNPEIARAAGLSIEEVKEALPGMRSQRLIASIGEGKSLRKHIAPAGLNRLI